MKLNIITPVTRPQNLPAIRESIRQQLGKGIDIAWWVIFDSTCPMPADGWKDQLDEVENQVQATITGIAGHCHRNTFLMQQELRARIESLNVLKEWIYCIDDDNILHPDLVPWLVNKKAELGIYGMVAFDQVLKTGELRLKAGKIAPNHIDTAQFMWRGLRSQGVRFREDLYNADGYFAMEICQPHIEELIVNQPLCYYNYLRS
ncbi:hypothetical protein AAHN97_15045 [Chitinophaga niabensis]|uniref:hypothetical protein n=1 Tax=Chitinophaga niabensis TaxID=536979 RepID=UPI0031B9B4E7